MDLTTWIATAIAFLLLFVILLLAGIVRKNLNMVIAAVFAFGIATLAGGFAAYKMARMTYEKAEKKDKKEASNSLPDTTTS
jgi:hypothetical protein